MMVRLLFCFVLVGAVLGSPTMIQAETVNPRDAIPALQPDPADEGTADSAPATDGSDPRAVRDAVEAELGGDGGDADGGGTGTIKFPEPVELETPLRAKTIPDLITMIIDFLLVFAGLVSMSIFFLNAWRYLVIDAGNAEAVGQRKAGMLWAFVGVVISFGAYGILELFKRLIGTGP